MNIAIDQITPSPLNPRKHFDEASLQELADSIREQGVLQPLTVRPKVSPVGYELVIGERRWRASKLAGLTEVPVVVRDLDDEAVLEIMLIENDQRADVSPLEEADAILQLANRFGRSAEHIADRIGRSPDFARRRMQLGSLVPDLRTLLEQERIGIGSAELLATLPEETQRELVRKKLKIDASDWRGEPVSWNRPDVRQAIAGVLRRMDSAPWDLDEPMGCAPECAGCPKRSSAQPSLLAEFAADDDRCLDGPCWALKMTEWLEAKKRAGVEVLEGDAADDAIAYSAKSEFKWADNWCPGTNAKYRDLAGAAPRVLAISSHGTVVELVRSTDLVEQLEESGQGDLAAKVSGDADKEARKKEREKAKKAAAKLDAKVARMVQLVSWDPEPWLTTMIVGALHEMHQDTQKAVCSRRGLKVEKVEQSYGAARHDYAGAIQKHSEQLGILEQYGLLAELTLRGSIGSTWGTAEEISKQVDELIAADERAVAEARRLIEGKQVGGVWEPSSLATRILSGEIPDDSELEALTAKQLRELLVDGLHVMRRETSKKDHGQLVELVLRYCETDAVAVASRAAVADEVTQKPICHVISKPGTMLCGTLESDDNGDVWAPSLERLDEDRYTPCPACLSAEKEPATSPANIYADERFTSPEAAELHADLVARRDAPLEEGESPLQNYTVKQLREVLMAWKGQLFGASTKKDLIKTIRDCYRQDADKGAA